ncbi:TPA: histidine phosphatase family protein [Candidatus Latescibacteria bacterium]|nr:histidine phosphatase family protein [Candidatus Latescibacterota bacterium]
MADVEVRLGGGGFTMTEMVVIRHGETEWNVEGRIQGWQDSELNARGRAQAEALGRRFRGQRGLIRAIYSSDLKRTMDTARSVADVVGLEIVADERLREWHLGCIETMLLDEARVREPEAVRIYEERDVEAVVPEGESIRERYNRCTSCLEEIAEKHKGDRVVVVTHGGILDDLYRFVNGVDLQAERDWDLFNCGINVLRIENRESKIENRWSVVRWGYIEHLEGIGSMADWAGGQGQVSDVK